MLEGAGWLTGVCFASSALRNTLLDLRHTKLLCLPQRLSYLPTLELKRRKTTIINRWKRAVYSCPKLTGYAAAWSWAFFFFFVKSNSKEVSRQKCPPYKTETKTNKGNARYSDEAIGMREEKTSHQRPPEVCCFGQKPAVLRWQEFHSLHSRPRGDADVPAL